MKKIVVILFALIPFLFACQPLKPVEFREVEYVQLEKLSRGKANVEVAIKLHNPNKRKFTVTDHHLDVLLNNKPIGNILNEGKVVIPAKSDTTYILHAEADLGNITKNLPMLIGIFAKGEADLTLKGDIKVKSMIFSKTIPVETTEKINAESLNFLQ
ncbi:LEA type 2 family protein [Cytophagaceae bacterium ABcell3]|nr:LEA type 2 family protein [Cytophagaceae bacterium ABcell3]